MCGGRLNTVPDMRHQGVGMKLRAIIFSMAVLASAGLSLGATPAAAAFIALPVEAPATLPAASGAADLSFYISEYARLKLLPEAGLNPEEIRALQQFYAARWNQPYWMGESGPKPIVSGLISTLADADLYALSSDDFSDISALQHHDWSGAEPLELARAEIRFMQAALLYGRQASAGRIKPELSGASVALQPQAIDPAKLLNTMSSHEDPGLYLRSLHPRSAEFARLRETYLAYRNVASQGGWPHIGRSNALKPGRKSRQVPQLRQRLSLSGDLPPGASLDNTLFDRPLRQALRHFQRRHGIKADGIAGARTRAALNVPVEKRISQLALNLERRRWLPDDLGQRHVMVNQPEYRLRVVEGGKAVHQTRVVIGKASQQTPEFSDEIELIVLNPYWNVPRSIATKEILPRLRRNPGYLSRKGMQLVNRRGKVISPYRVSWGKMSRRSFKYNIRQRPGAGNALGRIKFLFPNRHSVYLHDTPSKSLFSRKRRAFSHGCVRVQDPVKLAEVLMRPQFGWSKKALNGKISTRRNQAIRLKQTIPVHLTYHTAWVSEDGAVHFSADMYGRDQRLGEAMQRMIPMRKIAGLDLSEDL